MLGTAGTPEGMKLVLSNGAHLAFNHRDKDYLEKIKVLIHFCYSLYIYTYSYCLNDYGYFYFKAATDHQGVNVIIEMLSNVNLSNDLQLLDFGGRVIVSVLCFSTLLARV